jgi:hypothetical protein
MPCCRKNSDTQRHETIYCMSQSGVSGQQPRDGAQAIEFEFHEEKKHGRTAAERSILNQGAIQI